MASLLVNNYTDVILLIARMQPPTPAHKALMDMMIQTAVSMRTEGKRPFIKIILSESYDKEKNPLLCDSYKRNLVELIFNKANEKYQIPYEIICAPHNNIFAAVVNVLTEFKTVLWFAGSDRVKSYNTMAGTINTNFVNNLSTPSNTIVREIERTGDEEDEEGKTSLSSMSATKIRGLVSSNNQGEFIKVMNDTGLDDPEIIGLYSAIQSGFISAPLPKKRGGTRRHNKYIKHRKRTNKKSRK